LLTDRQTNKRGQTHLPPPLSEVIIEEQARSDTMALQLIQRMDGRTDGRK